MNGVGFTLGAAMLYTVSLRLGKPSLCQLNKPLGCHRLSGGSLVYGYSSNVYIIQQKSVTYAPSQTF